MRVFPCLFSASVKIVANSKKAEIINPHSDPHDTSNNCPYLQDSTKAEDIEEQLNQIFEKKEIDDKIVRLLQVNPAWNEI